MTSWTVINVTLFIYLYIEFSFDFDLSSILSSNIYFELSFYWVGFQSGLGAVIWDLGYDLDFWKIHMILIHCIFSWKLMSKESLLLVIDVGSSCTVYHLTIHNHLWKIGERVKNFTRRVCCRISMISRLRNKYNLIFM